MTTAVFWDRIAEKYAAKPIDDMPAYEQKIARVASLLKKTDRILEVGCGTGSTALRLAPHAAHVTATDLSAGMIKIARAKLGPDAPTNVSFQQAAVDAPVDGAPFDAVCAFNLLHLVTDLQGTLRQVHAQLAPGGLFLSKSACIKDMSFWMPAMIRLMMWVRYAPKVYFFNRTELVDAIQEAGFEIVEVSHFGDQHASPFVVAIRR